MKKTVGILVLGGMSFMLMTSSKCSGEVATDSEKVTEVSVVDGNNTTAQKKITNSGIKFAKSTTLEKAKKQAEKSGKLIFIDCYTSWCGPCKRMAATTFQDSEVGTLFNDNFINLKIDIEKDADGPGVARMYRVRSYPTLLVIDSDGKLVKQTIGFQTKDRLMAFANAVI